MNIRQSWLDYYQSLGFKQTPSASLIHPAFPTSFNMSAGLVQLDPRIRQPKPIEASKECLIQKCVRHFDIGKVGDDSHLSFFEMAGAFEVVELDEKKTIETIWKFLTEVLKIDSEKLWITTFDTDKVVDKIISLPEHLKLYLKSIAGERVILSDSKTNLWKQGGGIELKDNIQLCGPQVEIFYDFGEGTCQQNCSPLCGCSRFLELSNTLIIKYFIDRNKMPTLKKLVNPATEVVIGLERCQQVVEGKNCIFSTSSYRPLLNLLKTDLNSETKIIIDHIKSLTMILAEAEIKPARNERGRIIRTLIRNILVSMYILKLNPKEVLPSLFDEVVKMYEGFYPEVKKNKEIVLKIIFEHEEQFIKTLKKGKREIEKYLKANEGKITEEKKEYFWLYYGIPEKLLPVLLDSNNRLFD